MKYAILTSLILMSFACNDDDLFNSSKWCNTNLMKGETYFRSIDFSGMNAYIIDEYGVQFEFSKEQFESLDLDIRIHKNSLMINRTSFLECDALSEKDSIRIDIPDIGGESINLEVLKDVQKYIIGVDKNQKVSLVYCLETKLRD